MHRRDEKPQGFQEIGVNLVFILFPAGCFEQFNLTERQNPLFTNPRSRHNFWDNEGEGSELGLNWLAYGGRGWVLL